MGCWGITALQSDSGLDAIGYIRDKLLEDGVLDLEIIIDTLRISSWNRPPKASEGPSHTSLMAVAELIIIYLDKEAASLDYEGKWAANDGKFASIHSFTASKESLKYLRDYLSDSLHYAKENAVLKAEEGKSGEDGSKRRTGLAGRTICRHWLAAWIPFWHPKKRFWN